MENKALIQEENDDLYYPGKFSQQAANATINEDPFSAFAHQLALQDRNQSYKRSKSALSSRVVDTPRTPFKEMLNHGNGSNAKSVKSGGRSSSSLANGKVNGFTFVKSKTSPSAQSAHSATPSAHSTSPNRSTLLMDLVMTPTLQKMKKENRKAILTSTIENKIVDAAKSLTESLKTAVSSSSRSSTPSQHSRSNGQGQKEFTLDFDRVLSLPVERTKTGLTMKHQVEAQSIAYELELEKRDRRIVAAVNKLKAAQARERELKKNSQSNRKYAHIKSRYLDGMTTTRSSQGNSNDQVNIYSSTQAPPPLYLKKTEPPTRIMEPDLLEREISAQARYYMQKRAQGVLIEKQLHDYERRLSKLQDEEYQDEKFESDDESVNDQDKEEEQDAESNDNSDPNYYNVEANVVEKENGHFQKRDPNELLNWIQGQLDKLSVDYNSKNSKS